MEYNQGTDRPEMSSLTFRFLVSRRELHYALQTSFGLVVQSLQSERSSHSRESDRPCSRGQQGHGADIDNK
jgi:hypothetical protein